jgi:hypothetical protein
MRIVLIRRDIVNIIIKIETYRQESDILKHFEQDIFKCRYMKGWVSIP